MNMSFKCSLGELTKFIVGRVAKFSSKSGKTPLSLTQSRSCEVKVASGREPGLVHMLFFSFDKEIADVRRYSHT